MKSVDNAQQLHAIIAQQSEQIAQLKQQVDWFKRQIFGRKSEKQFIDNPAQINLFADIETPTEEKQPSPSLTVKAHQRRKNKSDTDVNDSGLRFDDSVPQKVIELSAPELQGDNADDYEIIDYKETTRLAQQPGAYVVLIYRRPVVRHKKNQTLSTASAPTNVLDGCYADVSLLAGMLADKFLYHLPLYRQHQRLADAGITLSRGSLTHWMQRAIDLLTPIYCAQRESILQSKTLAMDEVPIKAGRKQKGKMQQTWYWPIYGDQHEIDFTWSTSRGRQHMLDQLTGFKGTLLTDGYAAYSQGVAQLNAQEYTIEHANCWAHCRRTFEKSLKMEPLEAQTALDFIAVLYKNEAHIRENDLDEQQALNYRHKHSEPVINAFFAWVYQQRQRTDFLPSNPLAKALAYAHERQVELKVFLTNPHVAIDTNHLERALRVIPMGRKNYLFCWSEVGAQQVGIIQSLLVTCRLHGVNPYRYLVDVLQRISLHPASQVHELTPRLWKQHFAEKFFTSDLD